MVRRALIDLKSININADLGEGFGNDKHLMPYLFSCNVSCGAHAGSLIEIKKTIELAVKYGVKVGAHPGYPDKENFGRVSMDLSDQELTDTLSEQLEVFKVYLKEAGASMHHIKLHGALYNDATKDTELANKILHILNECSVTPHLYVPFDSKLVELGSKSFTFSYEAFIDRAYEKDGSLSSRKRSGAVLNNSQQVFEQFKRLVKKEQIISRTGEPVQVVADTFCIHGDHPHALRHLQFIHSTLGK